MQKLYCYVDETGQDTEGQLFIVAVVVTEGEREELQRRLERVERNSRKGRTKWTETKKEYRLDFWSKAIEGLNLQGKCFVSVFRDSREYRDLTILATAKAIQAKASGVYRATILVDALGRPERRRFGKSLRQLGIRVEKVRGLSGRSDVLLRFADALAGFAREYQERKPDYIALYRRALEREVITEL